MVIVSLPYSTEAYEGSQRSMPLGRGAGHTVLAAHLSPGRVEAGRAGRQSLSPRPGWMVKHHSLIKLERAFASTPSFSSSFEAQTDRRAQADKLVCGPGTREQVSGPEPHVSQFCRPEATQASPSPPTGSRKQVSRASPCHSHWPPCSCWFPNPIFVTSLWNIDCIPCWPSYLSLRLLFRRALPEAAWVTFTPRRPCQRVSWPQRKAGKKGRTLGRPQSIGVFLPAQQQPSSGPRLLGRGGEGPQHLCAAVALQAEGEKSWTPQGSRALPWKLQCWPGGRGTPPKRG